MTGNAQEMSENIDIIIHLRVSYVSPEADCQSYANDGTNSNTDISESLLKNTQGLNGANFQLYDATNYVYNKKQSLQPEDIQKKFNNMSWRESMDFVQQHGSELTSLEKLTTGKCDSEDGVATTSLPAYSSCEGEKRNAAYLLVETSVNEENQGSVDLERRAAPLLLVLPATDPTNGTELNTIHLYPKNIAYYRDPYFFLYGKKNDGTREPIEGAKFAVYKITNGRKEYLHIDENNEKMNNQWVISQDSLKDNGVSKFSSDTKGLVHVGNYLPSGKYYFEELTTAPDYIIAKEDGAIKLDIPATWNDDKGNPLHMVLDGQDMEDTISGQVPQSAYEMVRPIVYNYQPESEIAVPPTGTTIGGKGHSVSPKKTPRRLMQTGDVQTSVSILGMMLILISLYLWKKARQY